MVTRAHRRSRAFDRTARLIAAGRCVVLDGGTGTELADSTSAAFDERLWGINALVNAPREVLAVHRRYAETGCDVITTDTWGLAGALRDEGMAAVGGRSVHWMDFARQGVRLARRAAADAGRADELAVAFSLSGGVDSQEGRETLGLLARVFDDEPPDLILLETLSVVRDSLHETVEALLDIGFPVWMSFRRCPQGLCGVYGQHWGGPEGDAFGRAAHRFEDAGVGALLVNCIPPDHVAGMVPWLRDFTDLPLGVYPNLGYFTDSGWRFETDVGRAEYADMALQWRAEGAQLVGGCCGVGPQHIAAARDVLDGTPCGTGRVRPALAEEEYPFCPVPPRPGWTDDRGRKLFPLTFPEVPCDPGVFAPTQGSLLVWKYLFRERVGAGKRCLDVGCGGGLQTVQLALNGAVHVHALDLDRSAVANTLTNAFRNGVADRVSGVAVDLYPWVPKERYDVVVASLYQTPVDPFEHVATHRPLDYWGRNLIDHLIARLPEVLADDGVAYLMQLSIIGMDRTIQLLDELGFRSRVVDFSFFEFHELFADKKAQIQRVEEFSDAYHLTLGDTDVIVAYLVEVTHAHAGPTLGAV